MLLPEFAEFEHIAFLQHPAAEPHAAQDNGPPLTIDDFGPSRMEEAGVGRGDLRRCRGGREGERKGPAEGDQACGDHLCSSTGRFR
jgi:hypothetical protein